MTQRFMPGLSSLLYNLNVGFIRLKCNAAVLQPTLTCSVHWARFQQLPLQKPAMMKAALSLEDGTLPNGGKNILIRETVWQESGRGQILRVLSTSSFPSKSVSGILLYLLLKLYKDNYWQMYKPTWEINSVFLLPCITSVMSLQVHINSSLVSPKQMQCVSGLL